LEYDIVNGVNHEEISGLFIQRLSKTYGEDLNRALLIFNNSYSKPFLYQLVSSQLDMDRLDYLNRDSFYTGVSEGIIGSERLIEMLDVRNGNLVLEEKGIYSVEKFIVARRLMYWQVYLHKTVVAAEFMLIHALRRAKFLVKNGETLFASPTLQYFLETDLDLDAFRSDASILDKFANLDDYDILGALKVWQFHKDQILSILSNRLVNRRLFKIEISKEKFSHERVQLEKEMVKNQLNISDEEVNYFVYTDRLTNNAYNQNKQSINLLMKNNEIIDLSKASDNLNISALASPVEKFFICYPVD
jgi:hypothetical protein